MSDEWMITRGFIDLEINEQSDRWWFHKQISELKSLVKPIEDNIVNENVTCSMAIETMKSKSIDCLLAFTDGYVTFSYHPFLLISSAQ